METNGTHTHTGLLIIAHGARVEMNGARRAWRTAFLLICQRITATPRRASALALVRCVSPVVFVFVCLLGVLVVLSLLGLLFLLSCWGVGVCCRAAFGWSARRVSVVVWLVSSLWCFGLLLPVLVVAFFAWLALPFLRPFVPLLSALCRPLVAFVFPGSSSVRRCLRSLLRCRRLCRLSSSLGWSPARLAFFRLLLRFGVFGRFVAWFFFARRLCSLSLFLACPRWALLPSLASAAEAAFSRSLAAAAARRWGLRR